MTKSRPPFVVHTAASGGGERIAIERWSRAELEDRFHTLYARNLELGARNAALDKEIKM